MLTLFFIITFDNLNNNLKFIAWAKQTIEVNNVFSLASTGKELRKYLSTFKKLNGNYFNALRAE